MLRSTFLSHRFYGPIMVLTVSFSYRAVRIVTTEKLLNSIILGRTEGFAYGTPRESCRERISKSSLKLACMFC